MFTTVTAFAFTGVKSIKDMLISYGSELVNKLNNIDKERQKVIFSRELTSSWIIGIQSKLEEKGYDVTNILTRVDTLKNNLAEYNNNYKKHLEEELDKLYYKIKFYTFSFGVYSSLMIVTAALDGTNFFNDSYFQYHLYSFLITIYFVISYFSYKKYSNEVVKRYMKSFSIIVFLYIFIILDLYTLAITYFLVQLFLLSIGRLKFSKEWIFINITLIVILNISTYCFINIDEIIKANFLLNEYFCYKIDYKKLNYIFIFIFLFLYVIISLLIPSLTFRSKALSLRKDYGQKRDEVWNEFKGLMFVKEVYKEYEKEQQKILKTFKKLSAV